MSTIGDLRSLAASHLDSLKRRLDALHGDYVRDLEASHSRISKRVKMESHGCLQLAEEVDKEQQKIADKIAERAELVKTSYKKFVAEVQASTSRGTFAHGKKYFSVFLSGSTSMCSFLSSTCCVITLLVAASVQGDCP
nr:unknown [Zea mays]